MFGFGKKQKATNNVTKPQFGVNNPQGPMTPYFKDYYLRKVSGTFYEALREGIPVIDAAIRRLISLNGTIKIIGDNQAIVRELEDFCLNIPVNDTQKGIHAFLENAGNETFEQGFCLPEFVAQKDLKGIAELRVPDSKDIIFRKNAEGRAEPWYRNRWNSSQTRLSNPNSIMQTILTAQFGQSVMVGGMMEQKLNPANKLYFSINNENNNPYGVSLMRSMEFCSKLLATMQNSLGNVWERFGDPSYHVNYGLTKRSLNGETLEERRQKIANDFDAAIRAKRAGKSADFVSALNADDKMEISVIGADNQVLELEVPARHVLEQLIGKTGLPAWMLGIYWSTTERMATLEVEAILQDAKIRQLAMLPEFIRLFSTHLKMRGLKYSRITTSVDTPGDWGIIFETPNLRDMVAQAQARFLNAQADMMGAEQESLVTESKTTPPSIKKKTLVADPSRHVHKELYRPDDWPDLDKIEDDYEARMKSDWEDLHQKVRLILGLGIPVTDKGVTRDSFTFSVEERAQVLAALKDYIGQYSPDDEDSPVSWYYGQAYSLGLLQAVKLIGKDRPILDIIKNSEIYDALVKEGFSRVKDRSTLRIKNKILTEMEAFAISGTSPINVAERLKKLFTDGNSDWERLARSELSMAAERAKGEEWKAWGVETMDFMPGPDACSICVALKGEYPIDDCPLPVADTHPRCRCARRPGAGVDKDNLSPVDEKKPELAAEFTPASSLKEATEWALVNNLADRVSYKGASLDVANEWNRSVHDHVTRFPALRDNLRFIGTTQERQRTFVQLYVEDLRKRFPAYSEEMLIKLARRKAGKTPGSVYAYSTRDEYTSGISVNSKWAKDAEVFTKSLADNVESGFHPIGCDTVRSVVDHEMAHQLDFLLDIGKSDEFSEIMRGFFVDGGNITADLSRYALYSPAETIAEAWAEYLNNGKPRELAQKIGDLIESKYKAEFGESS